MRVLNVSLIPVVSAVFYYAGPENNWAEELGLWVGREHLMTVWRRFLGREKEPVDESDILSYRAAVAGPVLGVRHETIGDPGHTQHRGVHRAPEWTARLLATPESGFVLELRRQFMIWQTLREDIQERTPGRHGRWLWRAARYRDDLRLEGIILADIEGSAHQWSLIGNKIAGHDGGGRGGNLGGFPGDARAESHRSDLTSSLQGSYDRARSNAMETG